MVGRSIASGAGDFKIGVIEDETEKRLRMEVAALAISFESDRSVLDNFCHSVTIFPLGITNPPSGKADPETLLPASIGGRTEPKEIASMGSAGCESNQRPSHPEFIFFSGEAVCHLAIEEKCERSGLG
jgi:hypothetical protein